MTLKEIAKATGYSLATVSRVLNGTGNVSPESDSYLAITKYANKNGYRHAAHFDAPIAIVVPDVANPITLDIIKAVQQYCDEKHHYLIIANCNESAEQESRILRNLSRINLSGLILSPVNEESNSVYEGSVTDRRSMPPTVLIGRSLRICSHDLVHINNISGSFDATRFLLQHDYRNIAVIAGPPSTTPGRERLEGFHLAYKYFELPVPSSTHIFFGDFSEQSGYELTKQLLQNRILPEAIFPMNNLMTRGCVKALTEKKIPIGFGRKSGQVALISFDGDDVAFAMNPQIPYIRRPSAEMGKIAIQLLMSRIAAKDNPPPIQCVELSPQLVVPPGLF